MKTKLMAILVMLFMAKTSGYSQILSPKLSLGVVRSDIDYPEHRDEYEKYNTAKTGFYVSLNSGYQFHKYFLVDVGLTYQERLPLEFYDLKNTSVRNYPTSPQSEGWDADIHPRFPNIKYIHLELLPSFVLPLGDKLDVQLGAGAFYGYLLNHREQHFTYKDFPVYADDFEELSELFGTPDSVNYYRHDKGLMWKVSTAYAINERLSVGLSLKNYISYSTISDREAKEDYTYAFEFLRNFHTTWIAYAGGVDMVYRFNK